MIVAPDALAALPPGLVLVAGCFDPLHAGHLAYFEQARTFGPLCCAVASDAYIRTHKHRPPLLPQATRMALCDALCDFVIAQDESGEAGALEDVRPAHYAKGADWLHQIPEATLQACEQFGIPAVFLDAPVKDSSTARLNTYQRELDADAVTRFAAFMAQQAPAVPWTPVTDYSFEARRAIEGPHAKLIKDVFAPTNALDYGCGYGYLVAMLAELGVTIHGYEPQKAFRDQAPFYIQWLIRDSTWSNEMNGLSPAVYDLTIYREVNEHLTITQMIKTVRDLCTITKGYVYGTTRFHPDPAHLLDVADRDDLDPTHISLVTRPFLDLLFVLNGFKARPDLAAKMDWKGLGRTFVFERAA